MIVTFQYESELLAPVEVFLRRQGYRCQLAELPFYEYRVDIAGYDPGRDRIVAVELKLRRWKRAVQQACIYQLVADLTYVAMPRVAAARVNRGELVAHGGIGLITVDDEGECSVVVEAVRSRVIQAGYHDAYAKLLAEDVATPLLKG